MYLQFKNHIINGCVVNNADQFYTAFKRRLARCRRKSPNDPENDERHNIDEENLNRMISKGSDNTENDMGGSDNSKPLDNNLNKEQEIVNNKPEKIMPAVLPNDRMHRDDPLLNWMRRARKFQQGNYNLLGDRAWDLIESEDMLEKKIGFALFGIPIDSNGTDLSLNYNDEQTKCIHSLKNHIIMLHKNVAKTDVELNAIYIACIFVHLHLKEKDGNEGVDVLFRIPKVIDKELNSHLFIDANCRTYTSWDDYLNNTKLPKCYMCYPSDGIYAADNGSVKIGFKESPACKVIKSVLTGLDITSNILTIGATSVSIAALAVPIAAPFVWGATATVLTSGAYDISRCVNRLIDIKTHHESLSLKNPESRYAWIGLAASTVGVASIGSSAVARGVMKGEQVLSRSSAITLRILNVSSVAVNGVGVLNSLVTIVIKYLDGTLSKQDVLHFKWACYFFLNVIMSYKMANRLINDAAVSDITDIFHTSKNCVFAITKSALEFSDSSSYNMLRNLVLGAQSKMVPDVDLSKIELIALRALRLINRFLEGTISSTKFVIEMAEILESVWLKFKITIMKCAEELCRLFKVKDWKLYAFKSGYKPFIQSSPDVARQFCTSIRRTVAHCNVDDKNVEHLYDILSLIGDFNNVCPASNSADFLDKSKYICSYFEKQFDLVKESFELELDSVKFDLKSGAERKEDLHCFNEIQGAETNRNVYLFKRTLNELDIENALKDLAESDFTSPNFRQISNDDGASIETNTSSNYIFSGPIGCTALTEDEYWQKANDITALDLTKDNSILLSKNNIVFIRPNNTNGDIKAVIFYNSFETDCVMGIVTVLRGT